MNENECICLDTEFVNNVSIIELSVFSSAEEEIYHRLFRPCKDLKWTAPPDKLKITPEMVAGEPTFREKLSDIQPVFDRARYIIGYAIDNDIKMLEKEGVKGLEKKEILEVRNLYWLLIGRHAGIDLYMVPALLTITNELGFTFEEDEAHFASADTRATLRCFHKLMELLCENNGIAYDVKNPKEAIELYKREFEEAHKKYLKGQAHGYVTLYQTERGYKYKVSKFIPEKEGLFSVEVADRGLAELEILRKISKKEIKGLRGFFKLNKGDVDFIRNYSNGYEEGEAEMLRKLMKFKGRLNF